MVVALVQLVAHLRAREVADRCAGAVTPLSGTEKRTMTDQDKLEADAFLAKRRAAQLEAELAAAERQIEELRDRLTLRDGERAVLQGSDDGLVRINDLRPIISRVFG